MMPRMTQQLSLVSLVGLLGAMAGCGSDAGGHTAALRAYCLHADASEVESRIDTILPQLSLEQKASLMHGRSLLPLGGYWGTTEIEELDVRGIRALDGPRGASAFSGLSATTFPVAMARGATWDPALEERVGEQIGREVRARGADTVLAPTINLLMHPRWGRAQETYGEDPLHVGDFGVAFIRGAQRHVISTVKHFAANNIENTRLTVDARVDERTLREIYLPHFRRAVQEANVASVMSAYNQVNGDYASQNAHLLTDILRTDWGFVGFVMSDFLWGTHETIPALEAGLDLEMQTENIYGDQLADAVRAGDADEALLDRSVRRLLRAQYCYEPATTDRQIDDAAVETPEALALAQEVAERSLVLLRNEQNALPLADAPDTTVVVIGRLADVENIGDGGSSDVMPTEVITALEGLTARVSSATIQHVGGALVAAEDRDAVVAADAVVAVVGLLGEDEGEGTIAAGDRASIALDQQQVDLLNAAAELNDRVIVVLEGGGPISTVGWGEAVEGILVAWYPGSEGGAAIARTVFGDVNPSGRLPAAVPANESDLPPFDNTSDAVTYSYYHGYRHLDREATTPLYPFGFGLSYSTVQYSAGSLDTNDGALSTDDTLTVRISVANTGSRTTRETVQLYVGAPGVTVDQPVRALRAYRQVELAPGVMESVELQVPVRDLAYFDVEEGAWVVEPGEYRVELGRFAGDSQFAATVLVQ